MPEFSETPRPVPHRAERARRRRPFLGLAVFLIAAVLTGAVRLGVHLALTGSSPAAGERLLTVPDALVLTFTEPVELALSHLELRGPDGRAASLGTLSTGEAPSILTASIEGPLTAGEYTVVWQSVGRDGHPVRGEFSFEIDEAAEGAIAVIEPSPAAPVGHRPEEPSPLREPPFTSQSPLYAGIRWLMYLGILGVVGAVGFAGILRAGRLESVSTGFTERAVRGLAVFGTLALLLLILSLPLRLQAQSHAVFSAGITGERLIALLGTGWGRGWLLQLAGSLLALGGFVAARSGRRPGWPIAALGALLLVLTPAISGHAAAVERFPGVAIAADAAHVLAAGLWIGTLAALLLVGVPAARAESGGRPGSILVPLLAAFSPLALGAAGLLVLTGIATAALHLTAPPDLWTTAYGRLLSAKVFLVLLVVVGGAYNWRRMRPVIAEPGSASRLRRSGGAEVVAAVLVVLLTAVLVAVPPPASMTPADPAERGAAAASEQ